MPTNAFPKPEWFQFQRQVDFGYRYHESFQPSIPLHRPLPSSPPLLATPGAFCGCPACLSGGWYAVSPACRFWRPDCEICDGTRSYTYRVPRRRRQRTAACFRCQEAWDAAVTWFYFALRDPHAAARLIHSAVADRI